ncbi:YcjF family protein [Roseixanthobacter glucoisosaccharinicivorans]|uniref:YcjF family protein n=1 Tax=Roseixanthobacter glucoisosaccharinicivorans TaxID=3119923 RepID=UPI003727719F
MVSDVQNDHESHVDSPVASAPLVSNQDKAEKIVRSHALWAAGMGLIPLPVVDVAGVAGIQYTMIGELAKVYDLPFSRERIRAVAASVLGGGIPAVMTTGGLGSIAKSVPFIGALLGAAVMPALSAAATVALGRVFTQHFEAGGTLLDFEPEKMRAYFVQEFEKARADTSSLLSNAGDTMRGRKKDVVVAEPVAEVPAGTPVAPVL